MNVLSLFDGMSCGQIALRELGIKIDRYYASEINKHAIKQTQLNFPDTIQLGDVRGVHAKDLPKIDLLIGGSPCQGFSFAGKQLNFNDPRSALFFEFVRILDECREINPDVKFLLENVRMKREYEQVISDTLGIRPVMINSALVSAQNRVRLYWSNICTAPDGLFEIKTDIPQPKDRGLFLRDILEDDVDAKYNVSEKTLQNMSAHAERQKARGNGFAIDIRRPCNKSCALRVGGGLMCDLIALTDRKGRLRPNQDKASCLTVGGHGAGNHSDMDILIIQRPRGNNKGGTFTDKSPTLSANAWEHNNILSISSKQAHATVSVNKSTPLVAAMGMGGGHIPMVVKREVLVKNKNDEKGLPFRPYRIYDADGISPSICASHQCHEIRIEHNEIVRRITPTEAARLQTIPEWYKWECSATQQYTMLGNGWTVEVIKHIFSFLKQ